MALTWDRLKRVVEDLDLPPGHHALGVNGSYLAHRELPSIPSVDLLVSEQLYDQLSAQGWGPSSIGLQHPGEEQLLARTGGAVGPYTTGLDELIAAATASPHDGIPVVPLDMIDREADRAMRFELLGDVMARMEAGEEVDRSLWPRLPHSDPRARSMRRTVVGFGVLIIVVVLIVGTWMVAAQLGGWSHVLGQTQEVDATIVEMDVQGRCGDDGDDTAVEFAYEWEQDGERRRGTHTECSFSHSEDVGDVETLWVTDNGSIASTSSPLVARIAVGAVAAAIVGFGIYMLWWSPRRKRRLAEQGDAQTG